jgi:glycogen synthase
VVAHSDVVSWWVAVHGKEPDDTPWIRRYRELVKNGLHGADLVVAPSRWMLDTVSRHYVSPREGVVIYNGRTPELFDPNHEKEDFVLSVGRIWDEGKNVQLLMDAGDPSPEGAELTVHNQPKCGCDPSPEGATQLSPGRKPWVVATHGSSPVGTTDNSPALQRWDSRPNDRSPGGTAELSGKPEIRIVGWEQEPGREKRALPACSENVQLLGPKSQAELRELYASAAIYAATSRYEPFGLSPLEAALSGCTLVMNDIPVFHELWGDSALYFGHNDSASLFELIAELKYSPGLREQYGARAYLTARQKFATARMVVEYERAYEQILSPVARVA